MLFLIATLLSGKAVLPQAHATDIYLTALGTLLTLVYLAGLLFRPRRRIARLGIDSVIVLALYAIGIAGPFVGSPIADQRSSSPSPTRADTAGRSPDPDKTYPARPAFDHGAGAVVPCYLAQVDPYLVLRFGVTDPDAAGSLPPSDDRRTRSRTTHD